MRGILYKQPRIAMGARVALMMFAHGKAAAATHALIGTPDLAKFSVGPDKARVAEAVTETIGIPAWATRTAFNTIETASDIFSVAAEGKLLPCDLNPLSPVQLRLWLQAYNAGPYALLKYKGTVPYKETREYVPRIMKYYAENLKGTPYEPYILSAARKYGLDPQMIRAIMKTESDFNIMCTSNAGARGLMQVMPCVWSEIKARYNFDWDYRSEVFKPERNIEVACAYLAWLRYDFLPKHFADFDPNPTAPVQLIRDTELKPLPTRIVVASADGMVGTSADSAVTKPRKAVSKSRRQKRKSGNS